MIKFENIPDELKYNALWCCWKMVDGKKLPYNPFTGGLAQSNNPNTFSSFMTAIKKVHNYISFDGDKMLGGLGLGIFNGYSAIDIDHCVENGKISEMAQEIIDYCQSYTEYSPSGTGIRIIFKTDTKIDKTTHYIKNSKNNLEIYISDNTNKYVTITGNVCIASGINRIDLQYILDKYMKKKNAKGNDIDAFLIKDDKLNSLWNNVAPGSNANENELDCALISKLNFYFQNDRNKVEELFQSSPYFQSKDELHKNKWLKRQDYRDGVFNLTIQKETYNPTYNVNKTYDLTDTGNARRFIDRYGDNLRYNFDDKCWMIWNGKYWEHDYLNRVKMYVEILCEEMRTEAYAQRDNETMKFAKKTSNRSGKENMLNEAQHLAPITNSMFDNYPYYINCKNGVYDLRNGMLLEHNKDYYLTNYLDLEPSFEQPVKWLEFLNQIFLNDTNIINYMQKALGYALTGDISEQEMWFWVGDGANGKSVLMDVVMRVVGDYSTVANPDLLVDKKFQQQATSEVARLKGKRMVFVSETEMGSKLREAFVKDATGGTPLTARNLYCNEFIFNPEFKLFLITNHNPRIDGDDNGIWRRIAPIKFKRIFKREEQDKHLTDKLLEEKEQILGWIIKGSKKWYDEKLDDPQFLIENRNEYRKEMDIVSQWMDECCELTGNCSAGNLYRSYKQYCQERNLFLLNENLFGRRITKNFEKRKSRNGNIYIGISIKGC